MEYRILYRTYMACFWICLIARLYNAIDVYETFRIMLHIFGYSFYKFVYRFDLQETEHSYYKVEQFLSRINLKFWFWSIIPYSLVQSRIIVFTNYEVLSFYLHVTFKLILFSFALSVQNIASCFIKEKNSDMLKFPETARSAFANILLIYAENLMQD